MHRHVHTNKAMREEGACLRVSGVAVTQGRGGAVKNLRVRSCLKSPQLLTSAGIFACRSRSVSPSRVRAPTGCDSDLFWAWLWSLWGAWGTSLHHPPTCWPTHEAQTIHSSYFLVPCFCLPGNPKTSVQTWEMVSSYVRSWQPPGWCPFKALSLFPRQVSETFFSPS